MKSILLTIRLKYFYLTYKGTKNIEIRKSAPKNFAGDVYEIISKTNFEKDLMEIPENEREFFKQFKGKIGLKFTLKAVHKFDWRLVANPFFKVRGSCLGYDQLRKYATDKKGVVHDLYGWCISDLEIFDKPKELEEFYSTPKKINGLYGAEMVNISLSNPPQSWCFVEVEE